MARNITDVSSPLGSKIITDTDIDENEVSDVTGAASTIYLIELINPSAGLVHFKIYDNGAPTVGTTAPSLIIPVPAGASPSIAFPSGLAMTTAISYCCVQEAGTAGTTAPLAACTLRMVTS